MKILELATYERRLSYAKARGFDVDEVWYHGSPEKFDTFRDQISSYGYFVTHDPDTAMEYSGKLKAGEPAGYIYRVVLKVKKVLDITESVPIEIAKEMFSSEPEYEKDQAYDFIEDAYNKKVPEVVKWIDSMRENDDSVPDVLASEWLDGDDVHEWIVKSGNRELISVFEKDVKQHWEDYEYLEDALGTGIFYAGYQQNLLRVADNMGYDAVDMVDPSMNGEPYSRAVFNSDDMFIISRRSADVDIDDEVRSKY